MFRIIDIHTHILPGVDDGAGTWKDTLQLMQTAYAQGTIHMIATPHYSSRVDIDKLVSSGISAEAGTECRTRINGQSWAGNPLF